MPLRQRRRESWHTPRNRPRRRSIAGCACHTRCVHAPHAACVGRAKPNLRAHALAAARVVHPRRAQGDAFIAAARYVGAARGQVQDLRAAHKSRRRRHRVMNDCLPLATSRCAALMHGMFVASWRHRLLTGTLEHDLGDTHAGYAAEAQTRARAFGRRWRQMRPLRKPPAAHAMTLRTATRQSAPATACRSVATAGRQTAPAR